MENVFVEFEKISPHGNEELFSLICTSIGNYGMPFIRYEIGDLGVASSRVCPCGRGLPMIEQLKGRTHDILRTPSGKVITGNVFDIIFFDFNHIVREFQVRQKRLDLMEVAMAVRPGVKEEDLRAVMTLIKTIIGSDVDVTFNITEEIPLSASGKLHLTISEI